MTKRVWIVIAGVLAAVVLLAAFITSSRGAVPVRGEKAVRETIVNTIQTNGKIEPVENFEAHAPAATTVRSVLVAEGDFVKKGQLLLHLDDAEARAEAARALAQVRATEADLVAVGGGGSHEEVLSTQAELLKARTERDAAQRNLEAMRRLQQTGSASPTEVTEAANRLNTAQAQADLLQQKLKGRYSAPEVERVRARNLEARAAYAAAQETLRSSNVRAARAGAVYSLPVRQGQFVNAGDLLVQVADLSAVQVRAFVDEPDIGRLQKGQTVSITWDAISNRAWRGTLTRVPTTVILRGTRTVGEITCQVSNRDAKLLPNINVNVSVLTARHENALTVSREAMHQDGARRFVYQIVKGRLERQDVETSISNLTRIEITNGLQDGATVALASINSTPLRPKMPVEVVQR